jgi:hypothetical protein
MDVPRSNEWLTRFHDNEDIQKNVQMGLKAPKYELQTISNSDRIVGLIA